LGNLPSLESAFSTVKALFSAASTTTATLTDVEFGNLVEQHPELKDRLTNAATSSGVDEVIDLQKLFAGRTFSEDAKSPMLSSDISDLMRARIGSPNEPDRDVDSTIRTEIKNRVRDAIRNSDKRSAGRLLRSMPILKVEIRPLLLMKERESTINAC